MDSNSSENVLAAGRYLCFSLGKEKFAVPLLHVKEVLGRLQFTTVPQAPAYFKGVVNLRGQLISVIDLRLKLKTIATDSGAVVEATTIILDFGALSLGIMVDTVDCVKEYSAGDLSPSPDIESSIDHKFILCVAREDGGLVLILDLRSVLNTEDYRVIKERQNPPAA